MLILPHAETVTITTDISNRPTLLDSIKNADLRNLKPVKIEPKSIPVENSITDQIKKALDERRRFFKGGKYVFRLKS